MRFNDFYLPVDSNMIFFSAWQATETLSYVNQNIYHQHRVVLHFENKIHVLTSNEEKYLT